MPRSRVTWSQVEEGFYIGSRGRQFVGYVDRRFDGVHTAFDASSHVVGNFPSLPEAMAALTDAVPASSFGALDDN